MNVEDKSGIIRMLENMPEFKPAEVAVAEEVLDDYLNDRMNSGYHIFVAEAESLLLGYICYGPTPLTEGTWDIYWLAVNPKNQSQGIGKDLLSFGETAIRENNGRMTLIETSSQPLYEAARRFYSSQGYELACRIADYYAPGDDKLIFVKRLNR